MAFWQPKNGETARCAKGMPTYCTGAVTTGSISICGAPIQCGGEKKFLGNYALQVYACGVADPFEHF